MRVGAIPIYRSHDGLQFCLVSARGRKSPRFTFPKGVLKRREGWRDGAMRELHEEAGLSGRIILPAMPLVITDKRDPGCGVIFYWCEITDIHSRWPEQESRQRVFCPAEEMDAMRLARPTKKAVRRIKEIGIGHDTAMPDIGKWIESRIGGLDLRPDFDILAKGQVKPT